MDLLILLTLLVVVSFLSLLTAVTAVIRRKLASKKALEEFYAAKPVLEQKLVLSTPSSKQDNDQALGLSPVPAQKIIQAAVTIEPSVKHSNEKVAKQKQLSSQEIYGTVKFQYRDSDGAITERTVDVTMGKRGEIFRGYCHLRKGERSFFFDRIYGQSVVDIASGLSMSPKEWQYRLQGTKKAFQQWRDEQRNIDRARRRSQR